MWRNIRNLVCEMFIIIVGIGLRGLSLAWALGNFLSGSAYNCCENTLAWALGNSL